MTSSRHIIVFGLLVGAVGVTAQLLLLWRNPAGAGVLRGLITLFLAAIIGVAVGYLSYPHAIQSAALAGQVAGALISFAGLIVIVRNPAMLGENPFGSAEGWFSFLSSVLIGTVISSWLIAGVSVLVALPFHYMMKQRKELIRNEVI